MGGKGAPHQVVLLGPWRGLGQMGMLTLLIAELSASQPRRPHPCAPPRSRPRPLLPRRRVAASVALAHSDACLRFEPGPGCAAAGVLIRGPAADPTFAAAVMLHADLEADARVGREQQAALITFEFESCRLSAALGPARAFAAAARVPQPPAAGGGGGPLRVVGGRAPGAAPGCSVDLRVLLDWSVLEFFTGCGAALATRAYLLPPARRATAAGPPGAGGAGGAAGVAAEDACDCSMELVAFGGAAVARGEVYEMGSAWEGE